MAKNKTEKKSSNSLIKKTALIVIGVFLLYVIVGFWVVPPLLKPKLEKALSDQLDRKVTIEDIKINPLNLSVTTTNLTIYEKGGEPFAGFKELLIDAELSSIFRWAVVLKKIHLLAPFGVLKVLPDKTLNISDLLSQSSQTKPAPEEKVELPRAIISKLQVADGKFTLQNLSIAEPATEVYSPITFTLTDLSSLPERKGAFKFMGIGPNGGNYRLDGQLSVNPVRVQGSYSTTGTKLSTLWKHIKDRVSFQIRRGTTATSGKYLLELIDGTLQAKLHGGLFELKDFQLTEKGKEKVLISIPSFSVQGIRADVNARQIVVEQVKTDGARIQSWVAPDGTFNLQRVFMPAPQKAKEKEKSGPTDPKPAAGSPWVATIHQIEVNNWGAVIEDRTLPKPARIRIDDVTANIENLENKKNSKAGIAIALQINQAGTVRVKGSIGIDPLSADMEVVSEKIDLKPFQPYLDTVAKAQITSGTTSSKGRIVYQDKDGQPQISYQGELSVDDVKLKDRLHNEDLIRQKQSKASGIVLNLHPNKLRVADVLIDQTHARVKIGPNGKVNMLEAFTPDDNQKEKGKKNLIEQLVDFLLLQIKGPMPMGIDLVKLDNFAVDFSDHSISPTFKTRLEITKSTMKGLSSDPSAQADIKIEGNIDQSAAIHSAAQMNPLNAMQSAKIDFLLKGFKLKSVSAYSGKYAGYKIAAGTLNLDVKYRVKANKFTGDNIIVVDQLTFGDRVDSPDATHLPVKLGVALLKGPDGRITLQVPVSGNVKDPHFNLAGKVKGSLTGTVEKVAKSPFEAIKSIDGFKGQQLRFIEFEPGLAAFSGQAQKKLGALAKFLRTKPELILGIEGTADRQADGFKISGKQPGKKQQKAPAKDQAVDDQQLTKLAQKRADAVKNYMIRHEKIPAERIELKPAKIISPTNTEFGQAELYLSAQ